MGRPVVAERPHVGWGFAAVGSIRVVVTVGDQNPGHRLRAVREAGARSLRPAGGRSGMTEPAAATAPRSAAPEPPLLAVRNLEVVYDDVVLVLRASASRCPRERSWRCSAPTAPARRRCCGRISGLLDIHDGEVTEGSITFDGEPIHRLRPPDIVAPRDQAGDGGPADLRRAHRRGEPARRRAHRRRAARSENLRAGLRPVPGPRPSGAADGRLPLRRRAADARDRPGADVRPALPAAGRAEPRAGAAARRSRSAT